jgi:uncharacterized membrane protein YcaP (DUF421 family)
MEDFFTELLGLHKSSHTIEAGQMCARAVVVFFAALAMLRLSGKRTFGSNSPFDVVVKIMLGAVLSRAVVAASPFGATLLASLVIVALHRLLAWAAFHSHAVGRFIKGSTYILVEHGQIRHDNLRKNYLSEKDLWEGLRKSGHVDSLTDAETVWLERDGTISVILTVDGKGFRSKEDANG